MSDSGDFSIEQDPGNASQPDPGWYFAQGDPPGTERYWGGTAWEGTYRAVGGFSPVEVPKPEGLPGWLKVIAWILTVLKAIPLALLGVFVAFWTSITAEIQDDVDFEFRDASIAITLIGLVLIVIGVGLLVGQLVGLSKNQPGRTAVLAGIMTAFDCFLLVISIGDGGSGGIGFFALMALAQGTIFVMTLIAWNERRKTQEA